MGPPDHPPERGGWMVVAYRLDEFKARFDEIGAQLEKLRAEFTTGLEKRDSRLDKHGARIDALEKALIRIQTIGSAAMFLWPVAWWLIQKFLGEGK